MAEVEVIKAVDGPILRKRDYEGNPVVITRQRVAAKPGLGYGWHLCG